jgi:hypothetical protein
VADQATSRSASSSARTWQSMRRAEVLRNRPQARRTRGKRGWLSPRSGPLVSPRKMLKGPETVPAGLGELTGIFDKSLCGSARAPELRCRL